MIILKTIIVIVMRAKRVAHLEWSKDEQDVHSPPLGPQERKGAGSTPGLAF